MKNNNKKLPWWKEQMNLWEYSQWMGESEPSYKISGALFYPIWYGCAVMLGVAIGIGLTHYLGWFP